MSALFDHFADPALFATVLRVMTPLLLAALGVLRFPDLYTRMHAASKAGTVGSSLLLIAAGLQARLLELVHQVVDRARFTGSGRRTPFERIRSQRAHMPRKRIAADAAARYGFCGAGIGCKQQGRDKQQD